jgi:hypothetical protein
MTRYENGLEEYSFEELKKHYAHVQRRVYDALLALSPAQLVFELPKDKKFCHEFVDGPTYAIIGRVMSTLLEERNLILTRDDILVCFLRFRELIFIHEAVRQGVMIVKPTDKSLEYYYTVDEPKSETKAEAPTIITGQMRRYHGRQLQ